MFDLDVGSEENQGAGGDGGHYATDGGALRCHVHGQAPKLVCKITEHSGLTFEVRGCCHSLVALAKKRLAG